MGGRGARRRPRPRCPCRGRCRRARRARRASPAANAPSQRTTPTASRLPPPLSSASRAPSSTTSRPAVGFAWRSQRRNALGASPAGAKCVPRASPAAIAATTPSPRPDAITVGIPRTGGETRGGDLALHPAAAQRAARTERRVGDGVAARERLRSGLGGMRAVDAVRLRQQHEQPRTEQHRHLRRERVVVAEGDLVGRRRVVLVDHRDHAEPQQRAQRVAHVDVARPLREVGAGEQHLRGAKTLCAQCGLPRELQPDLARRRRRLELRQRARPPCEAQQRRAERDRPGRDDARALARAHDRGEVGGARGEQPAADAAAPVRDQRRAELDDDRHRCWLPSPTIRYCRRQRSR